MLDVVLVLVFAALIIMVFRRNRREQQQRAEAARSSLVVGARVMTTAGLHARVVDVADDTVVLEIAPGVRTTWARAAVARRVDDDQTPADASDGTGTPDSTADLTADSAAASTGSSLPPGPAHSEHPERSEHSDRLERPERTDV